MAAILTVASCAIGTLVLYQLSESGPASDRQALVDAAGAERRFDARLTGGFRYAPVTGVTRSAAPPFRVLSAAEAIERRVIDARSAPALGTLGVARLLSGDVHGAVRDLAEAVRRAPADAATLTDLSAAYLARVGPDDIRLAYEAAARATTASTVLPEAWFNRAIAAERLLLHNEARESWTRAADLEGRTEWGDEARRRHEALRIPQTPAWPEARQRLIDLMRRNAPQDDMLLAIEGYTQETRELVERVWLCDWSRGPGNPEGRDALRRAGTVARLLASVTGDDLLWRTTSHIEATTRQSYAAVRLASAVGRACEARVLYEEDRVAAAGAVFDDAFRRLKTEGSPFAVYAELYAAIGNYFAGDLDRAQHRLAGLAREAGRREFVALGGQVHWMLGLIHGTRAEFSKAIADYTIALGEFERGRERDNLANTRALLAEVFDFVGETARAWELRDAASSADAMPRQPRRRYTVLLNCGLAAQRQQMPRLSLAFLSTALDAATQLNRPAVSAEVLLRMAESLVTTGDVERADEALSRAVGAMNLIADPAVRERMEAEAEAIRGTLAASRHPEDASASLSRALTYFEGRNAVARVPALLLARGRVSLQAGDRVAATRDFERGAAVFESRRPSLSEELRISYFDRAWQLYEELISISSAVGGPRLNSLRYAERARARALGDSVPDLLALDPSAVSVGAGHTLLYYVSLPRELVVWRLRERVVESFVEPLAAAELSENIEAMRASFAGGDAETSGKISTLLYDRLIRRFVSGVPRDSSLIVLPHGPLHAVPFAALRDSRSGRYLIEDYSVAVAPSLRLLGDVGDPWTGLGPSPPALIVGNPSVAAEFKLPNLPDADAEAKSVADRLPGRAVAMAGRAATKTAFLAEASNAQIIHFAGHAIANRQFPWLSKLMFAPETGDDGSLFAYELARKPFDRTRLVVLSACSTGSGLSRATEGVMSLARPFLAAGVPRVVGSLWDVGDATTRALVVRFYDALQRGLEPAAALAAAQRSMLGASDPRYRAATAWAGFVIIRADTKRQQHELTRGQR